jgi:aspartyl-tRNA(Asn)/glutamyl-tRNA(Gln) amidotransferase subunit A
VPIVPSFDLVGVLARSVRDCVGAFAVASGRHPGDVPVGRPTVGVLSDLFEHADRELRSACTDALAAAGASLQLRDAKLDWKPQGFGRILSIELARVWGARIAEAPASFTAEIRASSDYGRGQPQQAEREARATIARARRELARRLASYDVVASPTCPEPVPPASESPSVERATAFTRIFSALGWPAFSLPVGRDRRGRPIALQLAARPERLAVLLAAAGIVETATRGPSA